MFSLIAAIGKNRELGKNGQLLWRLPGDLKFFKETTMGHPILMGRKTFESLPGMLPGRKHYVLTSHPEGLPKEVEIVKNLSEFIAKKAGSPEEIFVIGGGMVYWEMWKHCRKLYLTEVDAEDGAADTFFPEFNKSLYERTVIKEGSDHGINYVHALYTKK